MSGAERNKAQKEIDDKQPPEDTQSLENAAAQRTPSPNSDEQILNVNDLIKQSKSLQEENPVEIVDLSGSRYVTRVKVNFTPSNDVPAAATSTPLNRTMDEGK